MPVANNMLYLSQPPPFLLIAAYIIWSLHIPSRRFISPSNYLSYLSVLSKVFSTISIDSRHFASPLNRLSNLLSTLSTPERFELFAVLISFDPIAKTNISFCLFNIWWLPCIWWNMWIFSDCSRPKCCKCNSSQLCRLKRGRQLGWWRKTDAHHGNGVEESFYSNDRIMSASFHNFRDYFPDIGDVSKVGCRKVSSMLLATAMFLKMDADVHLLLQFM